MLSPDFLYFLAQTVQVLEEDDTLLGVSAFNYNGKLNHSGQLLWIAYQTCSLTS